MTFDSIMLVVTVVDAIILYQIGDGNCSTVCQKIINRRKKAKNNNKIK